MVPESIDDDLPGSDDFEKPDLILIPHAPCPDELTIEGVPFLNGQRIFKTVRAPSSTARERLDQAHELLDVPEHPETCTETAGGL